MSDAVIKALEDARGLIAKKDGWIRGALARTVDGHSTHYDDPGAVCFCSLGALYKAAKRAEVHNQAWLEQKMTAALAITIEEANPSSFTQPADVIVSFNDRQDAAEPVLAAFDATIKRLKEENHGEIEELHPKMSESDKT